MKKLNILFLIILSVLLAACGDGSKSNGSSVVPVVQNYVSFVNKTYNISAGSEIKLEYKLSQNNIPVTFMSGNEDVVSVTSEGVVKGIKTGSAEVTIEAVFPEGIKKDTCTINIDDIEISYLGYAEQSIILEENASVTPELIILPEEAKNKTITFQSDNRESVTVDNSGKITGKKTGSAVVTAIYGDKKAAVNVTVKSSVVNVGSISLNVSNKEMQQGESFILSAVVSPDDADNKNVKFSSSNKNIAVVSPDGKVTAQNAGHAVITAETEDGSYKAECQITVIETSTLLTSLTVENNKFDFPLFNGTSLFINITAEPVISKYSNLSVTSTSDAVSVSVINRNMILVEAKKQGYAADIEIKAENCGYTDENDILDHCTALLRVYTYDNEAVSNVENLSTVEPYNILQDDGTYFPIYAVYGQTVMNPLAAVKVNPANAAVSSDEWDITTPKVADSDDILYESGGKIHTQGVGRAIINVGILGNSSIKPVTFDINVVQNENMIPAEYKNCAVTSISINDKENLKAYLSTLGEIREVTANVSFEEGCQGIKVYDYSVSSSDKNVVDIIDNYAYAKGKGRAVITVKSNSLITKDGADITDSFEVEIK